MRCPHCNHLLAVVVAGTLAFFAVSALFLIPVAMSDSQIHGPQRCPQCGEELTIHPWSS